MVFCATVYCSSAKMRILCHCRHTTKKGVLRQLVFNLVAIGYLRHASCDGLKFAHTLMQNVNDIQNVNEICMTYGKNWLNEPNGWQLHVTEL